MNFNSKCIWIYGLEPHLPPLTSPKKMKCSFLDYIQLLMISWADQWTRTPSATRLQPKNWNARFWITFKFGSARLVDGLEPHLPPLTSQKKWNVHFWITFNFWWSAGLVDGLEPHPPPLSNQKNEMLIFGLHSTSDDWPYWCMDSNPICHPSPARKMKCLFLFYIHFWWLAGLVNGLEPHPPPLSSQKNEMLVFGLHSTSDDQLGWSMDSNPIGYPPPTKKLKCSFLDYIQILISRAGWWTWTPSATPLQPKKMKCSLLDYVQLLMIGWAGRWTWTPSTTPLQPKKWNAHFWITFNFWWLAVLVDGLEPHLPPLSSQKNEMLIFGLCSTSDDRLGWLMDSNPICHPSPAKKWNAHFWITFNFWWSAGLVDKLKPHLPPLSSQKNKKLASPVKGLPICSSLWML